MTTAYNAGKNIGAVLGDLFMGKNREPGKAYYDQLATNYEIQGKKSRSEELFEKASIARAMNMARQGITPELLERRRAGDLRAEAELGAAVLRAAQTPNLSNYTRGALDLQEIGFRDAAVEAGIPELGAMNANLAGVANGPIKTNDIDSGYQINPYQAGGAAIPTQGELGKIADGHTRANRQPTPRSSGGGTPRRTASEASAIVKALEKEMGRTLTAEEVATVYSGGDFNFRDEPATAKADGRAPAGVDQSAYAKAMQKKADALSAIKRGAPKEKVAERLREQGYPKLAELIMGAKQGG